MINTSNCRVSPISFSSSTRKSITTDISRRLANLYLNHVHRFANDVREREEKMAKPCRRSDNANLNEQHNLAGTVFRQDDIKRVSCSRSSRSILVKQLTTMHRRDSVTQFSDTSIILRLSWRQSETRNTTRDRVLRGVISTREICNIDDREEGRSICKIMAEIAAYERRETTRFRAHRFTCKIRDSGIKREIISAIARSIDFVGPMENLSSSSILILPFARFNKRKLGI